MGYRRKTCSYCGGDHAILDCNKLIENAALAEKALLEWDEVGAPEYRKNVIVYCAYERKRNTNPETLEENPYVFQKKRFLEVTKDYNWRFDRSDFSNEEWSKLPEYISYEQYRDASDGRWNSARSYQNTVSQNAEVRAKAKSRAQKSCSYCRQSGHTVRTCPQKRIDQDMHFKAYKISAYYYARALSRFGVWTGSMMVETSGDKKWCKMLRADSFKASLMAVNLSDMSFYQEYNNPPVQVTAWAESNNISVDDIIDYLYLRRAINADFLYTSVGTESQRYGSDARRIQIPQLAEITSAFSEGIGSIDDLSTPGDTRLYPSTATLEHIYNILLSRYCPPEQKNKYYNANNMSTTSVSRGASFYFCTNELFDKKQRGDAWFAMETFVQQNQETLNIADNLIV